MWGLWKFIAAVYRAAVELLDPDRNALRHAPAAIRYGASILLACLWCLAFGIWAGELWTIGYNMLGHILVISMAFATWAVFRVIMARYPERDQYELLRDPARQPKCYEMTDQERQEALARSGQRGQGNLQ